MKYLIIGAGGTGGAIGAYLTRGGLDCTLIARGDNLSALVRDGLTLIHENGESEIIKVNAVNESAYSDQPDVVFVCVKGYSLDSIYPLLRKVCNRDTIVIPILNLYGIGAQIAADSGVNCLVTDGCVYMASQRIRPGVFQLNGDILRIVYGVRDPGEGNMTLFRIREELKSVGIDAVLSDNIRRDALQKFSYVSPMAAAELYHQANAGEFKKTGDARDFFICLVREIDSLANAMEIPFLVDVARNNLAILDSINDNATTSLYRDIEAGLESEVDGLIFEVLRMGKEYQVSLPCYTKVADEISARYGLKTHF